MGIYVITGGTTGIGAEARKKLQDEGHEVFNIDYNGGDYTARPIHGRGKKGRSQSVILNTRTELTESSVMPGVGPTAPPKKIFALNFFAAIAIAEGLRPLLKKKGGNCVVTSSNSITNATVKRDWVDMLSNVADENATMEFAGHIPPDKTPSCYSSSKHALARWVRRVSSSWAADGLRINAVAPGNTTTPMTKGMTEKQMDAALLIPIPTRYGRKEFLDASEIANAMVFLLSPLASGINGVILFVDGGIDALLRSERF